MPVGVPTLPEPPGRLFESASAPAADADAEADADAACDVLLPILLLLLLPRRTEIPEPADPANELTAR